MFSCAKDETNSFRFHSLFVPENLQLQLTMISHSSHTEIGGLSRRFLFYIEVYVLFEEKSQTSWLCIQNLRRNLYCVTVVKPKSQGVALKKRLRG